LTIAVSLAIHSEFLGLISAQSPKTRSQRGMFVGKISKIAAPLVKLFKIAVLDQGMGSEDRIRTTYKALVRLLSQHKCPRLVRSIVDMQWLMAPQIWREVNSNQDEFFLALCQISQQEQNRLNQPRF